MGCVCCSLSSFVSIVLHALERITLCTVCTLLTCCLLFTIITVLVMGIGIGFHYCTVQNNVDAMEKAAKSAGALRSGGQTESPMMRSVNKAVKRGFAHRLGKRDRADALMPSNNNTINDAVLLAQNNSVIPRRIRRELPGGPDVTPFNNTAIFIASNDSMPVDYTDEDVKRNLTTFKSHSLANASVPFNNTWLRNAILIRQNCSLLNLFSRLF